MFANCLTPVLCLLAASQAAPRGEVAIPPKIERFLELCERSRRGAILQLEHTLRGLQQQSPPSPQTTQRMAKLERQLSALRSRAEPIVPQLRFPPQNGTIGRLPRLSCHVDQVVSDNELLVRCYFPVVVTTVSNFQAHRQRVVRPVRFLIRGLATEKFDEGSDVQTLQVFEVVGKEQYRTTTGGQRDVIVLTHFDMKSIEPYFEAYARQNP